ncbi:extensin-like [Solanum dulcamara]|uniref:extensin-like n=1 Tax=Solanum dulcamara TaxID=45834 RepID=UPI00248560AF|nr:extensin-like [Solanum dulcamara]
MSNQQRPFSWFRLAPFGRQMQPTPPPTPRPTAFRAPAPQPYRPPAPQPRPTIRRPAVTAPPPPPPTAPARALFPGITTTPQPAPRSPTPSTAPSSPAKSILSSSPTSPTFLPIISSSFSLRSPETKTPAPYSSSLTTNSPFPKPAASPPKTAPPAPSPATTTVTAPTTSRIAKPLNELPPKHSKMNEKSAMDNKKVSTKFEKLPRRLVTLIGENKGAIMVLKPNSTKKSYTTTTTTNVFGGKSQIVGKKEEANTAEGEMGSKKKNKEDQNDMNTMEMEESTLFINSNIQGVNNSILDDSSLTHHDPGFHIFFSTD